MNNFKIGDKVVRTHPTTKNSLVQKDGIYTVNRIRDDGWLGLREDPIGGAAWNHKYFLLHIVVNTPDEMKASNPKDAIASGKLPLGIFPPMVHAEVVLGLTEGRLKYGGNNWRAAGVLSSVYTDATLRHVFAYLCGQDIDPDSGLPHLSKAMSSLAVLRDAQIHGMCEDNRAPVSDEKRWVELNEKTTALVEKYGKVNPEHITQKTHPA